ncbi:MAG: HAD family hydrolase [Myxococcota bacterium]|nr:HAD family hydrolase [Myxococcota bacterium]
MGNLGALKRNGNLKLGGIEALSFDLFDTLVDQDFGRMRFVELDGKRIPETGLQMFDRLSAQHEVGMDRFFEVLQEVDRDLREPRFAEGRELPTQERFEEVLRRVGHPDPILASELTEIHMRGVESCTAYCEHHREIIERLRSKRPIALCSNFSHSPTALKVLEQSGLRPHFDVVIVSDAVDSRKPFRPIFEAVLEGLGVAPEHVLHVGDRLRADVTGPSALGMRTAWITRRVKDREATLAEHEGPTPDLEIEDLSELEALLD